MTIGTGIFLSALFIGFVALVIGTRDKWKWGRIIARAVIGVAALTALASAGFYAHHRYTERPVKEMELWGIRIGDTESDVLFKKGKPKHTGPDSWVYEGGPFLEYAVLLNYHRVFAVMAVPTSSDINEYTFLPAIQGVDRHWSVERVVEKFGPPSETKISEDEMTRVLSFRKYNVAFMFEKNTVLAVMVFDGFLKPGVALYAKEEPAAAKHQK
jgi:hypothetical protein